MVVQARVMRARGCEGVAALRRARSDRAAREDGRPATATAEAESESETHKAVRFGKAPWSRAKSTREADARCEMRIGRWTREDPEGPVITTKTEGGSFNPYDDTASAERL
jgi:hypothetical protein